MAAIDISTLTPNERLELIGELWDSLSETPEAIELSQEQREELDRRIADLERDRKLGLPLGIPAEELPERIRARFK